MDDGGRAVDPVDLLQADRQVMLHWLSLAKIHGQPPIAPSSGSAALLKKECSAWPSVCTSTTADRWHGGLLPGLPVRLTSRRCFALIR